ncbi:DUF2789 domain-containing protein [Guyparkeria sp. SCN-R1]|uniref:DUF2789 domain-containing protein n=1 Tax=unclassified Guyparkeria TaxID=2626246 RepID=UPI000F64EE97|nr:DUF2789 domain-containing protein [Guyparkeria sp. SCN-R1]RRQ24120.1 DUF2789 domain-containing protein [Guyparkeria sp. SCN-R1]
MQPPFHPLSELFEQLGLDASEQDIEAFIDRHSPLPSEVVLSEAPFWNENQRRFLRESLADDADWAEAVDHLDARLRD